MGKRTRKAQRLAQEGPSLASIAAGAFATLGAMGAMLWALWSPVIDTHAMAGAIGCLALAVLLFGQSVDRAFRRERIQEQRRRERVRRSEEERRNTGVWIGPGGQRLEVRWQREDRSWHVIDPVGRSEQEWNDKGQLIDMVLELEAVGYACQNDEATRGVRARLDLPGYEHDETGQLGEREIGEKTEKTVRLDYRPEGGSRAFTTEPFSETERARWMDTPTEIIRREPIAGEQS